MKEIRAYIQPFMLARVTQALLDIPGFPGMSVSDCQGFGREKAESDQDYTPFFSKKRLEIFTTEALVEPIVTVLLRVAHSGQHGDGKVYVVEVLEGARISTGEKGPDVP
jgi:nitrogen regulatory protein PII